METLFYIYKQKLNFISCAVIKKKFARRPCNTLARARKYMYIIERHAKQQKKFP